MKLTALKNTSKMYIDTINFERQVMIAKTDIPIEKLLMIDFEGHVSV